MTLLWLTLAAAGAGAMVPDVNGFLRLEYVQSEASLDERDGGSGEPLNENRFRVAPSRLQLRCEGESVAYSIDLDFGSEGRSFVGLHRAVAILGWPRSVSAGTGNCQGHLGPYRLSAGLFHVPFGYEVYNQNNRDRVFANRATYSDAFFPGQSDLGVSASGVFGPLDVVVAVQNGEPIGGRGLPSRDPNAAKDVVARMGAHGHVGRRVRVDAGLSFLGGSGFHPGTLATKDQLVWRDFNQDGLVQLSELQNLPATAATPSESFARWAVGADLRAFAAIPRLGPLLVYAELAHAVNLDRGLRPADPVFLGRDQRALGYYVAAVQQLRGGYILAARYDVYEPDLDDRGLEGGTLVRQREVFRALTLAAGLTFALVPDMQARLMLEYAHRRDPLGLDAAGRPTDLANDLFTAQLQLNFW